jgi:SAM-dependent methyltransferase
MEHLINPDIVVEKCRRILKPGGIFLAHVPVDDKEIDNVDHYHFFSIESISYLFKKYFYHIKYKLDCYDNYAINDKSSVITMIGCKS